MSNRAPRRLVLLLLLAIAAPAAAEETLPRVDGRNMVVFQAGYDNVAPFFAGVGQLALHSNSAGELYGIFQAGLWNSAEDFVGVVQLGAQNHVARFAGAAQIAVHNTQHRFFAGVGQIGAYNEARREFYAALQLALVNDAAGFIGGYQIGLLNRLLDGPDNIGPSQIGLVNVIEHASFSAIGQIGAFNWVKRGQVWSASR